MITFSVALVSAVMAHGAYKGSNNTVQIAGELFIIAGILDTICVFIIWGGA